LLVNNNQALKIIDIFNTINCPCTYNFISGKIYYENMKDVEKIYPPKYKTIKIELLSILKSNIITTKDTYLLLNNFLKYNQDVVNKMLINKLKISKIYGFIGKNDLNIIIFIFKMLSDYGTLNTMKDIPLSNFELLITKACESVDRCVNKDAYKNILCNKKLIHKIMPKIIIFYKLLISNNTDNIQNKIRKNKLVLYQIWNAAKYSNHKKLIYKKDYFDNSC
jgi:hypothetical protein